MNKSIITGMVFNMQRDSTEDGPGIRTTVFLKGCLMHCPWCHNPESIKPDPELVWYDIKCIGCRKCINSCPRHALSFSHNGIVINRSRCIGCGECTKFCPSGALQIYGKEYTVKEAADIVLRDKVFYEKSGGGITISGGEPSLQVDFIIALMQVMREEKVHIALDTCGGVKWQTLKSIVELSDLVLYDIKCMDSDNHLKYTGISLELVLENAKEITKTGKPMWIRTPIIPGYTDSDENVKSISRFIKDNLPSVQRYDLLAFNNLCVPKYRRLDRTWVFNDKSAISQDKMENLAAIAKREGLNFVNWSGMTKK